MRDPRWAQLPASLGPLFAAQLDVIADELIAVVREEVPLYARPVEGSFGRGIRLGVQEALRQFCLLVETAGAGETGGLAVYEELGRGEWRNGRPLESLLAAYRVGARVAWRRFALLAADDGLGTHGLVALAELVFAHIDELSAASTDGYVAQQAAQAGERDRARQALLRLLLAAAFDRESVAAAARLSAWHLPATLCAVVAPAGTAIGARLGSEALIADADPVVAVIGDPPATLSASLDGTGAVIGPTRDLSGAAVSRDRATALLRLRGDGVVLAPSTAVLSTDEHLLTLVLHADTFAAHDLSQQLLGPLAELAAGTRSRLEETLRAWLQHAGERASAAAALHVHPQTVRYRLGRLRELLGDVVDDPAARLPLLVALEVRAATPH